MTTLRMLLSTLLMTVCAAVSSANLAGLDLRDYEVGIDRADRDAGLQMLAMSVCATGDIGHADQSPVWACNHAYELALAARDYESAMHYVAYGCTTYLSVALCRHAARLPLVLGRQGVAVPETFGDALKQVAAQLCFSGTRIQSNSGADVTARECAYFARLFNLARDAEYLIAPEPAATRILESLHDRAFAGALHAAACERLGALDSCELAQKLGVQVGQTGAGDASASAGLATRQEE